MAGQTTRDVVPVANQDSTQVESSVTLVDRWVKNRDPAAADELYRVYVHKLLALIARNQPGRVSPDDVVQSTVRTFLRRAEQFHFDGDGALWKLLVTIALNKLRREKGKKRPDLGLPESLCAPEPSAEEEVEFQDLRRRLMAVLSLREKNYLALREQSYRMNEIAEIMGVSDRQIRRYAKEVERKAYQLFADDRPPAP